MERALELLNESQLDAALLRLWVVAGTYHEGATHLNRWERDRNPNSHAADSSAFATLIQQQRHIAIDAAIAAPLALIQAVDQCLALLRSDQPFFPLSYHEAGDDYWLVPVDRTVRQAGGFMGPQANNREAWFKHHAVLPCKTSGKIEVVVRPARSHAADRLDQIVAARAVLRVWLGHFDDQDDARGGVRLEWRRNPASKFRITGLTNAQRRSESIEAAWVAASNARADIWLLPELTVTLTQREELKARARPIALHPFALMLAGSFHEELDGDCYNTAQLWDAKGEAVLVHRKLRPFGAADGFAEDVADGNRIEVLVTTLGSFAIPICKDFLDGHARVSTLFREVPVDWVLVPSYGEETTVKAHRRRAEELARVGPGITSLVANQRNVEVAAGPCCPGFAFVAGEQDARPVAEAGSLFELPIRPARRDGKARPALKVVDK